MQYTPVRDHRLGVDGLIGLTGIFNSSSVYMKVELPSIQTEITEFYYNGGDICQRIGSLICIFLPFILLLQLSDPLVYMRSHTSLVSSQYQK
jgi:hypothetical protein